MAYNQRNILVGAASLYVSKADSSSQATSGPLRWVQADGGTFVPVTADLGAVTGSAPITAQLDSVGTPLNTKWRDVGGTTDGVEVSYEPDFGEVTIDQALDTVKMFKQAMRFSVRTTLVEATLDNLLLAWAQGGGVTGAGTASEKVDILAGDLGDEPLERSLLFVGQAPKGVSANSNEKRERIYHVRRALQVESSAHSLSRADATTFPVSFRCMASSGDGDTTQKYGTIIQRVRS